MALWGIFYTVVPLVLVGGLILAGAGISRKDEYDPRRSYVVYLLSTMLVSLVVLVSGVTVLTGNIAERVVGVGGDPYQSYQSQTFNSEGELTFVEESDSSADRYNTAEAIQAALIAGVALLLLYFHASKLAEITKESGFGSSIAARTYNAYLYLVCFATVLGAIIATAVALYALIRVAAPGSVGTLPENAERDRGIVDLLQFGVAAGLSSYIFRWHWKAAEALRPGAVG